MRLVLGVRKLILLAKIVFLVWLLQAIRLWARIVTLRRIAVELPLLILDKWIALIWCLHPQGVLLHDNLMSRHLRINLISQSYPKSRLLCTFQLPSVPREFWFWKTKFLWCLADGLWNLVRILVKRFGILLTLLGRKVNLRTLIRPFPIFLWF